MGASDGMFLLSNFARAVLSSGISAAATSFDVVDSGSRFPTASATTRSFYVEISDEAYDDPSDDSNREFLKVTVHAGANNFGTVVRGQLGTSAADHNTVGHTYRVTLPVVNDLFYQLASGYGPYALDTGAANAYVTAITSQDQNLTSGLEVVFIPANTNTATSTLNHNGTGATGIIFPNGQAVPPGGIKLNVPCQVRYNSTLAKWVLLSVPPSFGKTSDGTAQRVFHPKLRPGTTMTPTDQTAYALYMGYTDIDITINYVELMLTGNYTSITAAEVGIHSSPLAPNKGGQTLTKITSQAITGSNLTSGASKVVRNASALSAAIPAGTHWWAVVRIDHATVGSGAFGAVWNDYTEGNIMTLASAGVMSSTSTYAMTIPTDTNGQLGPQMHATMD